MQAHGKALVSIKKYLATSQPRVLVVREVVQALVSLKRYLASLEYCIIIELPIMLQC